MIKKDIIIGIAAAIVATLLGCILYVLLFSKWSLDSTFEMAFENEILGSIIAIGAVANFFPFFVFIKKKQDNRAKGVLIMSIITAIIVAVLKFI